MPIISRRLLSGALIGLVAGGTLGAAGRLFFGRPRRFHFESADGAFRFSSSLSLIGDIDVLFFVLFPAIGVITGMLVALVYHGLRRG